MLKAFPKLKVNFAHFGGYCFELENSINEKRDEFKKSYGHYLLESLNQKNKLKNK
jgi:predicted TIM-barrel fold metal-dependent hydrolase